MSLRGLDEFQCLNLNYLLHRAVIFLKVVAFGSDPNLCSISFRSTWNWKAVCEMCSTKIEPSIFCRIWKCRLNWAVFKRWQFKQLSFLTTPRAFFSRVLIFEPSINKFLSTESFDSRKTLEPSTDSCHHERSKWRSCMSAIAFDTLYSSKFSPTV